MDDLTEYPSFDSGLKVLEEPITLEIKDAAKFDEGKLRFELIPSIALEELAYVFTIGAMKYEDDNWRKGLSWRRLFGAMMRHAWKWFRGEERDEDGQHHLGSVMWCAATLLEHSINRKVLDDRFEPKDNDIQVWQSPKITPEQAERLKAIKKNRQQRP